jgi:hypothetical protein
MAAGRVTGLPGRERGDRHLKYQSVLDVRATAEPNLLSPALSSIPNGGEDGRRPGEEALGGSRVQRVKELSENSLPEGGVEVRGKGFRLPPQRPSHFLNPLQASPLTTVRKPPRMSSDD